MESYQMSYDEYLDDCKTLAVKSPAYASQFDESDDETNYKYWMYAIEEAIEEGEEVSESNRTAYSEWLEKQ